MDDLQQLHSIGNQTAQVCVKVKEKVYKCALVDLESLTCLSVCQFLKHKRKNWNFLLGVAWFESWTHDWLAEPCKSHEHGIQGLSSSALTWSGKDNVTWSLHQLGTLDKSKDEVYPSRSVEPRYARLTVDPSCVITAAHTHTTPSPLTTGVQAE